MVISAPNLIIKHLNRQYKVAVNLRNVAGVTADDADYQPKICKIKKGEKMGLGFHLLYLEDRNGVLVQEVAPKGAADKAMMARFRKCRFRKCI